MLCPNCHRGYHCGEIEISFKDSYFNEDYYEWEVVNYTNCQIDEDLNIINRYEKKKIRQQYAQGAVVQNRGMGKYVDSVR